MRLVLKKIQTTPHERTIARTMQANWIVPDDEVPCAQTSIGIEVACEGAPTRSHLVTPA
jgi:hypothetical protein